jgi:PadR family transcriptional regulator PadR
MCRTRIQEERMMNNSKEVQVKLMKGLLDLIVLQFLSSEPMHGYQIITKIRRSFGVYFGPSTIYPLLNLLEKKGYVKSEWNMENERPRKIYNLTTDGQNLLNFTEDSLNFICRKIGTPGLPRGSLNEDSGPHATLRPLLKKIEESKSLTL